MFRLKILMTSHDQTLVIMCSVLRVCGSFWNGRDADGSRDVLHRGQGHTGWSLRKCEMMFERF